ncbi:helix-hairpin-helix domain-containing protein [Longimicrobium terrae]|uniref:Pathogenicity locus n=1 Tax=Longimicrobium terrae TaxID=1639882 RepID=A0A841H7J4_9BACT|nr:helix-hairpin-helix domain-containing protein [Longimicrobium terrae]MBB4639583.1 hypothetical protein [Longimicrobium terrae]MBB6073958.1 hypothetical protein [Longimicrobium terrae]NNC29122.1 Pathogenicity locus [Longimicrobium terrae]
MPSKSAHRDELQRIPGVGPSLAADLRLLGFPSIQSLRGADPVAMYERLSEMTGVHQDRCVLYVFRCAVYFASEPEHDADLLLWWSWKDDGAAYQPGRAGAC